MGCMKVSWNKIYSDYSGRTEFKKKLLDKTLTPGIF